MPRIEPFEKYSSEYDKWFDDNLDLYMAELEAIRQLIPPAGSVGMEVGVGSGRFAAPLGIEVGVEPSKKMADKARSKGIEVYAGSAEELPFTDCRFDFVLMVTTICFVDDIAETLREAFRVVKSGGSVIVGFVDRESELAKRYFENRESSRFYKDATFVSVPEVLEYLKKSGFVVTNVVQTLIPEESLETVLEGFGKGAFVVIKGMKE